MREEELEVALKVVIVGNGGVGKSSMIQRYCKGTFTKDYKKTIGVDFLERQIEVDGEEVRLMLWDTAGQEEFDAITKAYYRGAQACVLAFSTTDRDSFEAAHSWKLKVENECGEIPTVIVQNKIDLLDQSVVNPEEAELLARALGCRLVRTSVKEDVNVSAVFRHLAQRCLAELRDPREDDCVPGDYFSIRQPAMHHNALNIREVGNWRDGSSLLFEGLHPERRQVCDESNNHAGRDRVYPLKVDKLDLSDFINREEGDKSDSILRRSAFSPSHSSKNHNGTIVLKPHKHKKKKNVLKNACRIL